MNAVAPKEIVAAATTVAMTASVKNVAIEIAKTLSEDETFNDEVAANLDAKEKVKQGPLHILMDITRILGEEGMSRLPDPDSEEGKTGNEPFDKYKTTVFSKDGAPKAGEGSFYVDLTENLREGKNILLHLEHIEAARLKQDIKPVAGLPAYPTMAPQQIRALKSTFQQRLTSLKRCLIDAVWVFKIMERINSDEFPKLECQYQTIKNEETGNEELLPTNSPMVVFSTDPKQRAVFQTFSIGQFTSIDLEKVKEYGGDIEGVLKAMARKKREPETEDGISTVEIVNVTNVRDALVALYDWQENQGHMKALYNELNKRDDEAADDLVMTIGDLYTELFAPLYDKYKTRYANIIEARQGGQRKQVG